MLVFDVGEEKKRAVKRAGVVSERVILASACEDIRSCDTCIRAAPHVGS
jgi:hypothetical protein